LIISHQYIGQLVTETSTRVRDAIFGNAGTILSFRVGAIDAEFLETQFAPEIMAVDLVNLPNYNIYLKLLVDGISSRPFSATTLPPIPLEKELKVKERIIDNSRRKFGSRREVIEKMIEKWSEIIEKTAYPRLKERKKERREERREERMSLGDLAKREPENFKRKSVEPDLEGVRKALEKAVEGNQK